MTDDAPLQREPGWYRVARHREWFAMRWRPYSDGDGTQGEWNTGLVPHEIGERIYMPDEIAPGEPAPKAEASDSESVRWAVARGKLLAAIAGADGDAGTVLRLIEDHESAVRREATSAERERCVKALREATFEPMPRPTIAELEAILNGPEQQIHINPDGSIGTSPTIFEKAADYLATNKPQDITPARDPEPAALHQLFAACLDAQANGHPLSEAVDAATLAAERDESSPARDSVALVLVDAGQLGYAQGVIDATTDKIGVGWRSIATAPQDGSTVWVYTAAVHGLPPFEGPCAYHSEAGWCTDELRPVTHWQPIPDAVLRLGNEAAVNTLLAEAERLMAIIPKKTDLYADYVDRQRLARSYQDAAKLLEEST